MPNAQDFELLLRQFDAAEEPVAEPSPAAAYKMPSLTFLRDYQAEAQVAGIDSSVLENRLKEFGLEGTVEEVSVGPFVTRYGVRLSAGVKLNKVRSISEDLAIALMSDKVRIQAPIPGTSLVGIEIVNKSPAVIGLKEIMKAAKSSDNELPIAVGVDTTGKPKILDLAQMPHLLVAGQTGSGKSVFLNSVILSMLYTKTPDECRLVLIDPKRVEMSVYANVPHLLCPVITEPENAIATFSILVREMERRYDVLKEQGARNIKSYNRIAGVEKMPYIVAVVDEMADLMMTSGKELEVSIVRLAQLARAVGIHLVLATQKPVVKVITGLIKSNMPSRVSFLVSSKTDSRVILDQNGADKLAGRGDMLTLYPGVTEPERLHGAWVSDKEIRKIVNNI